MGERPFLRGFFHCFSASFQRSQVSQATRNRVISPVSDAKAAGEGEEDNQGLVAAAFWQDVELSPKDNQALLNWSWEPLHEGQEPGVDSLCQKRSSAKRGPITMRRKGIWGQVKKIHMAFEFREWGMWIGLGPSSSSSNLVNCARLHLWRLSLSKVLHWGHHSLGSLCWWDLLKRVEKY